MSLWKRIKYFFREGDVTICDSAEVVLEVYGSSSEPLSFLSLPFPLDETFKSKERFGSRWDISEQILNVDKYKRKVNELCMTNLVRLQKDGFEKGNKRAFKTGTHITLVKFSHLDLTTHEETYEEYLREI